MEVVFYDKPGRPKQTKSSKYKSIIRNRELNEVYGPEKLYILNGQCFGASIEKYEYKICPFQNATQARFTAGRAQLLGFVCVVYVAFSIS